MTELLSSFKLLYTLFQMEDKIKSELEAVQKKIENIEKTQEMLKKINEMERMHDEKMGKRPSTKHRHGEMM